MEPSPQPSAGDDECADPLACLYKGSYTACCRLAYALLGDRRQAEDCVMDAFASVAAAWDRGRIDDLEAYLRRAVVNRSRSLLRRRRIEQFALARVAARTSTERIGTEDPSDELDARIWRALQALPPTLRTTLALHYIDDLSIGDVATILRSSTSTVRANLARGRSALRSSHQIALADDSSGS